MKFKLTNLIAVALLSLSIAFTSFNSVMAAEVKAGRSDTVKQAAQEVVKETGAKEHFGKGENGEELIDKAKNKANQKLNDLAEKANSGQNLPDSQEQFLDNVHGKS